MTRTSILRDWRTKAVLQKGLSLLPSAGRVNYVFQRRITKTLPITDAKLRTSAEGAKRHLAAYEQHAGDTPLGEAQLFEFGAGWDLHNPLLFFAHGVNHQTVVDLFRFVRPELVMDALRRLPALVDDAARARLASVTPTPTADLDALTEALGVVYQAPADARATNLANGSIDFVTSSSVLEHIPRDDIASILRELRRILRPGGVCSFFIDAGDHFARFDKSIASNNFLRYSEKQWSRFVADLSYHNRLRYPQYMELFAQAGFTVLSEEHWAGGSWELDRAQVHSDFQKFSDDDLAITAIHVVLTPG
ncbi:MAG: hypothetical protein QOJ00_1670 [Actinomycetota bacterium]|jgi:SAM-dependent methyltransferase